MQKPIIIAGQTSHDLAAKIAAHLAAAVGASETLTFSDGNLYVQIKENIADQNVIIVQTLAGERVHDDLMELSFLIDASKRAGASKITAMIPYFSYAKADKHDRPGDSLRARVCADLLQVAGVNQVIMLDLHNPSILGCFGVSVAHLSSMDLLCERIKNTHDLSNTVLVSPDAGFAKNAWLWANKLGLELAVADKYRPDHSEKPGVHTIMGNVAGKNTLIVDDFSTSGGTLIAVSDMLLQAGAISAEAVLCHAPLSESGLEKLQNSRLKKIITTNTVPWLQSSDKLEIVDISSVLAAGYF